ncbi:hypothetical protein GN958_ATG05037 [Phytophthora infestans]|uniref:Uncharacterized protein n=1 Tax=Phytophthora infestans TaxID=4787 RepID=A0A8S9UYL4_PHYIN|nr:hypothetical protein GN958_ATG05037 [Phytophthora infestans]
MPRRHARAPKRSDEASGSEASSSSDSDSAAETSRSSYTSEPRRARRNDRARIFRVVEPEVGLESSGASELDTTSGNNATVSNRGSGDGGIVARDDLVHVSKIDVKMFDDWKTLEAYLRNYGRRTYQVCVPISS